MAVLTLSPIQSYALDASTDGTTFNEVRTPTDVLGSGWNMELQHSVSGYQRIGRFFAEFDISAIPYGSTINSINFKATCTNSQPPVGSMADNTIVIAGNNLNSLDNHVNGWMYIDLWNATNSTQLSNTVASLADATGLNTFPFNTQGLTYFANNIYPYTNRLWVTMMYNSDRTNTDPQLVGSEYLIRMYNTPQLVIDYTALVEGVAPSPPLVDTFNAPNGTQFFNHITDSGHTWRCLGWNTWNTPVPPTVINNHKLVFSGYEDYYATIPFTSFAQYFKFKVDSVDSGSSEVDFVLWEDEDDWYGKWLYILFDGMTITEIGSYDIDDKFSPVSPISISSTDAITIGITDDNKFYVKINDAFLYTSTNSLTYSAPEGTSPQGFRFEPYIPITFNSIEVGQGYIAPPPLPSGNTLYLREDFFV